MKRILFNSALRQYIIVAIMLTTTTFSFSQNEGDYKTVQSGDWSSVGTWNIYFSGAWNSATTVPRATNESDAPDVYIENNHKVTLSSDQSCGNLFINIETEAVVDHIRLSVGNNNLNVWGKMRLYTGTVGSHTSDNGSFADPFFIRTGFNGYITFKGTTSREIIAGDEFSASGALRGWNMKIDFNTANDTAYVNENVRMSNLLVSNGTMAMALSKSLRPYGLVDSLHNGSNENGWVQVESGGTLIANQIFKAFSRSIDSIIVQNGGTLKIKGQSQNVIAASGHKIEGTLVIAGGDYPTTNNDGRARTPENDIDTVANIIFDNELAVSLQLPHDLHIQNKLTRYNYSIDKVIYSISYEDGSTVEYAGTKNIITGNELDGITNITLNTSGIVELNSDVSIQGDITFAKGLMTLNDFNLTLGENSTIQGTPSVTSMLVTNGDGELRKLYSEVSSFTFPVGDTSGAGTYSPIQYTLNSGTLLSPSGYIGAKVANRAHPAVTSQSNFLNKYWSMTSNITNIDVSGVGVYASSEVIGDESKLATWSFSDKTIGAVKGEIGSVDENLSKIYFSNISSQSIFISAIESIVTSLEYELNKTVTIGPNPSSGSVSVSVKGATITDIQVVSQLGVISQKISNINASSIEFNLKNSGVQFLQITTDKGVVVKRVFKV